MDQLEHGELNPVHQVEQVDQVEPVSEWSEWSEATGRASPSPIAFRGWRSRI